MIRYFYEDELEDMVKKMNEYSYEKTTVEKLKKHLDYMVETSANFDIQPIKSMYVLGRKVYIMEEPEGEDLDREIAEGNYCKVPYFQIKEINGKPEAGGILKVFAVLHREARNTKQGRFTDFTLASLSENIGLDSKNSDDIEKVSMYLKTLEELEYIEVSNNKYRIRPFEEVKFIRGL